MVKFTLNGKAVSFAGDESTPLLWVLRDEFKLYGTKYGCGIGSCGACTIHLNGRAQRSCITEVSRVQGANIKTIEGLSDDATHPVQQAWLEIDVPQCGYCQAGQIMAASDLLSRNPDPSDDEIDQHMTNICRCGTYVRIRKAIHRAAAIKQATGGNS